MSIVYTPHHLQSYMMANAINGRLIGDIGDTPTVPAAAQALGVIPDQIIKTLLFMVKAVGAAKGEPNPVVVISHGERLIERKLLAERFAVGRKRIKLAEPTVVLDLLGYPAGGVPPFGHRTQLPVILDASVLALAADEASYATTTIYGGGGDDRTMLELTLDELMRVVQPEVLAVSE